jgi:hypothetical protein
MRIESKKYLYDMSRASALALEFIRDKSFFDYQSDAMLSSRPEPPVPGGKGSGVEGPAVL